MDPNISNDTYIKIIKQLKAKLQHLAKSHKTIVKRLKDTLIASQHKNKQLQRELDFAQMQLRNQQQDNNSKYQSNFDINDINKGSLSDTQLSALRKHFEKELSKQVAYIHERDEKIQLLEKTLNNEEAENSRLKTVVDDLNEKNKTYKKKIALYLEQNEKLKHDLDESKHKVRNHNQIVTEQVAKKEEIINNLEIEITNLNHKISLLEEQTHNFNIFKMKETIDILKNQSHKVIHHCRQEELNDLLRQVNEAYQWIASSRIQTKEELENLFMRIQELESEIKNKMFTAVGIAI